MYRISELSRFPSLIHGFSTKADGNMSFRFGKKSEVIKNRKRFLEELGASLENTSSIINEHKDKIVNVDSGLDEEIIADGLITSKKGVFLFLKIADCIPLILYDSRKRVVGLIHAGWKGVDINIAGKAVAQMVNNYHCIAADIIAVLGPAAQKDSFIKKHPSQLKDPKWGPFLTKIDDKNYQVDCVGLCFKQLIDAGVEKENIINSKVDTVIDKRFFSYYRDSKTSRGDQGRFACVVSMK